MSSVVTYDVVDGSGHAVHQTLEGLEKYLAKLLEMGFAFRPIKRIVKVTREDIELPDFVVEYNKKCEEHKDERT